ncbi:MAG: adenylate kinase [Saprospiraceae bacterium]|nr:adenylate kinase [Saprospiraceae bacterium]
MINLILFGPPGSGKGTQAHKLADRYNFLHISTGDLFRHEIGHNTELGLEAMSYISKGLLVPDEITIGMLRKKMEEDHDVAGVIFDGFPRNVLQSEALDELLAERDQRISALIALDVDDEEIVNRIMERAKTSGRPDDADEAIIRNRIEIYKAETTPVFDYYAQDNRSHKINGVGDIEEIFSRLSELIDSLPA